MISLNLVLYSKLVTCTLSEAILMLHCPLRLRSVNVLVKGVSSKLFMLASLTGSLQIEIRQELAKH